MYIFQCQTTGISIYELNVIVGMVGPSGVWVRTQEGLYEVTCNFGSMTDDETLDQTIDDR